MKENINEENVLVVRMLGGFSMRWQGVELVDSRQSSSQFGSLMQLLFCYRKEGVSRKQLQDVLFEERELEDAQHALRNTIYNARRRLKSCGLPDVEYIRVKKGHYFWTEEIPTVVDTEEVTRLMEEANRTDDTEHRRTLLTDVCRAYSGPFLERMSGAFWVTQESRRLQGVFREAVEKLAEILRQEQRFRELKELADHAVQADPFAEWEVLGVEALVALGRYEEAQQLCDNTVDSYILEHGQRTTAYMRELVNRLNETMSHQYESLEEIQNKLADAGIGGKGGYFCTFPVFQEVYRTVARMMERHGDLVFLMLCTVTDTKGNPMREGPKLDELSERLREAILKSVRRSDTVTRYGKGQFLVLLANTTKENSVIVQERIERNFTINRQRTSVEFLVNSVIMDSL